MKITYRNGFVIVTASNALGMSREFGRFSVEGFHFAFPRVAEKVRLWQARARASLIEETEYTRAALQG